MSQPIRGRVLLALLIAPLLSSFASRAAAAVDETPPVKVNRTVPRVIPPSLVPRFSAAPSDAEISGARVFEERLVPIGRTSIAENRLLADQLLGYVQSGGNTGLAPFEKFLTTYPSSAWRASILLNSGIVYRRTGYISRALDAWRESWELSKGAVDPLPRAVADRALGEYAGLLARLGLTETLAELLTITNARNVGGSAAEKMEHARDGLAMMRAKPEIAFRCGPLALDRVLASLRKSYVAPKALEEFPSTLDGTSLAQVAQLARDVGQPMRMAKRTPGAAFKVPAVVHWKSGHFAALVREHEGAYLIEDATFDDQIWISRDALESETSGYALIEEGPLPANWRVVGRDEASRIWGKGQTFDNNPQNYKCSDRKSGCEAGSCSPSGMAVARAHLMLVSLNIVDEPVGYSPSLGPAVRFTATYNQREVYQPQTFSYSNLGPKWTFDWLSYIEDNPLQPTQNVQLYVRGGGQETYGNFNTQTQTYDPHKESRAFLVRTLPPLADDGYQRHLPDGSVETFSQLHGAPPARKVFLTSVADARGNTMAFTYGQSPSGGLRLTAIQDAEGQVTTLAYDDPLDDLKITEVTDPFDRSASFEYLSGRLSSITDVLNLTSAFQYGSGDFIQELTTPYGTSVFEMGETTPPPPAGQPRSRWLKLTDPLGASERVEYYSHPGAPHELDDEDPDGAPAGGHYNGAINWRNTFYWSKRAISDPLDYSKARIYHWLHTSTGGKNSGILESYKDPLESRIWYLYPGQGPSSLYEGTFAQPSRIARLLDGDIQYDTGQVSEFTYNLKGKVCTSIDPMSRETHYTYGTGTTPDPGFCEEGSGIDLLKVERKNGTGWEQTFEAQYDTDHQPTMTKDAAGQITSYTYLPDGTGRDGSCPSSRPLGTAMTAIH